MAANSSPVTAHGTTDRNLFVLAAVVNSLFDTVTRAEQRLNDETYDRQLIAEDLVYDIRDIVLRTIPITRSV